MPDISLCDGMKCPKKESCYRYTATPNEYRQSYFGAPPYDPHTGKCEYYWPVVRKLSGTVVAKKNKKDKR